jgi:hypothetical protein
MVTMANPRALAPEIDDFRRQFEQLSADADALVAPLTDEQFHWQPRPDAWSVAQCLEHLNVTARVYLPRLDEGIADAIRRGLYAPGPFAYNWIGRLMVWVVQPTTRVKAKASKPFQPTQGRPRQEVMAAFRAYQVQYIDRLRQANGLDLARARVSSPVVAWLRMPLGAGFAVMTAHERRHLQQARRVLGAPGFPR